MAAHDFVDNEGFGGCALLVADIVEEGRADFGGRPGAKRLLDRNHVIVHRLRQTDDGEVVAVGAEIGGEVRCGRIGVVTADGMKNGDAVSRQAAIRSGLSPSLTRPRLAQSAALVSLTRLLPIGEPP